MKQILPYSVVLLCTFLWCVSLFLPPWLAASRAVDASVSRQIYQFYSLICHQYDSRSLHFEGHKLAVCARCTAIYIGFFLGVVILPFFSRWKMTNTMLWLTVAVSPMIIDVALDMLSVHASTLLTRLTTGGFFGIISSLSMTPILMEACSVAFRKRITT